jgi:hypothetical protein
VDEQVVDCVLGDRELFDFLHTTSSGLAANHLAHLAKLPAVERRFQKKFTAVAQKTP